MRAKKRKRDDDEVSSVEGIDPEQPKQGMKPPDHKKKKKKAKTRKESEDVNDGKTPSRSEGGDVVETGSTTITQSLGQHKPSKAHGKVKKQKKEQRRGGKELDVADADDVRPVEEDEVPLEQATVGKVAEDSMDRDGNTFDEDFAPEDLKIDLTAVADQSAPPSTGTPTSAPESPIFDKPEGQSDPSSTSSIVPSTAVEPPKKPLIDSEALRARLQARIEALRAARHADGPDGARARTRQELIEARRRKEEQRKAHKKELRRKAKEDERIARDRALSLARSPDIRSPGGPPSLGSDNAFSFGRMAFNDGQRLDRSLTGLLEPHRRKGPQDPLGAMKATEAKHARLNGFDEQKRKDIEEKDMWLHATKRLHGEKVRDDTSLLKKTLKRQEKAKHKSELEWNDRIGNVEKGKEVRQKKRDENLRKRRDEKGGKGGGGGGKKKTKTAKIQKRPGFEGTFRAKPRSKKT